MLRASVSRFAFTAGAVLLLAACSNPPGTGPAPPDRWGSSGGMGGDVDPRVEARFTRLDLNADGVVTWNEAYDLRSRQFAAMDLDRDGAVTGDEYRGRAMPFAAFDQNGDGVIHLAEYLQQHRMMFQRFDMNGDGALNLPEFAEAQRAVRS